MDCAQRHTAPTPPPPDAVALCGAVHEAHQDAIIIKQRGNLGNLKQQ
jgi:hypothetical protein